MIMLFYLGRRLLLNLLLVTTVVVIFIYTLVLLVTLGRISEIDDLTIIDIFIITVYAVVPVIDRVFPLLILFATSALIVRLHNDNEIVALRAAGLSTKRIIPALVICSAIAGILQFSVLNPIAVAASTKYETGPLGLASGSQGLLLNPGQGIWLRQSHDGTTIFFRAQSGQRDPLRLERVSMFESHAPGKIHKRIEARTASLVSDIWLLRDVVVYQADGSMQNLPKMEIENHVSAYQLAERTLPSLQTAFWQLYPSIANAKADGLPAGKLETRYHHLLARPIAAMGMVLLAVGCCSYIRPRQGVLLSVVAALCLGMLTFMIDILFESLGQTGTVQPFLAGWLPATSGLAVGLALITVRETG